MALNLPVQPGVLGSRTLETDVELAEEHCAYDGGVRQRTITVGADDHSYNSLIA